MADTTEAYDRHVKLPRYALAGIPEVWLVLVGEREAVEVYRRPGPTGYAEAERLGAAGTLPVRALPGASALHLNQVLPG